MNQPTNAEIAGKLDGMGYYNLEIKKHEVNGITALCVNQEFGRIRKWILLTPLDLLAFCRAVVERVDGKNKKLQKIFNALDNHLGDTDPDILEDATDEEICDEEPVFWAANEIAKILKENK